MNLAATHMEAIKSSPYAATYDDAVNGITIPPQYTVYIDIQYSNDASIWVDSYTDETLEKIVVGVLREGRGVLTLCTYRSER